MRSKQTITYFFVLNLFLIAIGVYLFTQTEKSTEATPYVPLGGIVVFLGVTGLIFVLRDLQKLVIGDGD